MNQNNTTFMCTSNNTGNDVLVWQIGAFLLPIIGLPGHVLMIAGILNFNRRNFNPMSWYYVFLSLTESIYLSFLFWDWLDIVDLAPDPRQILNCAYFYPFVNGAAFISLLLLVQLNLDRIRMINHPQQTPATITNKRILMKIFFTYMTSIFFFLHYRFSLRYSRQAFIIFGQSCCVNDHAYRWFYSIWPYIHLFSRLIPCIIIVSCTSYVCRNRCRSTHSSISSSIHRQQQIFSIVLVVLSIYTSIAILPITILQFFNHRMSKYETDSRYSCRYGVSKWKLVNAIFIMWEGTSYMIKFYVRFFVSSQFRHDVKRTICCQMKSNDRQADITQNKKETELSSAFVRNAE